MFEISSLFDHTLLENTLAAWLIAAALAVVVTVAGFAVRAIVRRRYRALQQTEQLELLELPLEVASKTATGFIVVLALFMGARLLTLTPEVVRAVTVVFTVVGFWQLGMWGSGAVLAWLTVRQKRALEANRAAAGSLGIIGVILRGIVWALILLLTLDNLGVDITALVAGLGVGGIAVALAVQNILGDLFASLSITLDRPFVLGDFVILDDFLGSVEHIGIKSTRLRSLGGEQIVISNADLLKSRLRNYGRMHERRVVFTIGVTYETPRAVIAQIPGIIRTIIESQQSTRFDRSHFAKYGDFALVFETVYYVLSPDYGQYMDVQQAINLALHERFEQLGVEFARPMQKLWLQGRVATDVGEAAR